MTARTRRILTIGLVAIALAAIASPAVAGGWWSYPQLEYETRALGIGEATTVSAHVGYSERDASTTYYAYLVRGYDEELLREGMRQADPERWWARPDEAIRLGQLVFERWGGTANVHASFEVPQVEPGLYALMLCTVECREPLAEVVPLEEVYVGDIVTVRLLRDVRMTHDVTLEQANRVYERLRHTWSRVVEIEGGLEDLQDLDGQIAGMTLSIDAMRAAIDVLERRVADPGEQEEPQPDPWWARVGWFVAGVALAGLWVNRRRDDTDEVDDLEPDGDTDGSNRREEAELPEPEFITLG